MELTRLTSENKKMSNEVANLHHDVEVITTNCYEIARHLQSTEAANSNLSGTLNQRDIDIKDKQAHLSVAKKDIGSLELANAQLQSDFESGSHQHQVCNHFAKTLTA